jgi:hypothetical protein
MHSTLPVRPSPIKLFIGFFIGLSVFWSWTWFWSGIFSLKPGEIHPSIQRTVFSPDHKLKAVVFTNKLSPEDVSINVSILKADAKMREQKYGNVFCDWGAQWADVSWTSNNSICVAHTKGTSISSRNHFRAFDRDIAISEFVPKPSEWFSGKLPRLCHS